MTWFLMAFSLLIYFLTNFAKRPIRNLQYWRLNNSLEQCFPMTGPRTNYGPPNFINWEVFLSKRCMIWSNIDMHWWILAIKGMQKCLSKISGPDAEKVWETLAKRLGFLSKHSAYFTACSIYWHYFKRAKFRFLRISCYGDINLQLISLITWFFRVRRFWFKSIGNYIRLGNEGENLSFNEKGIFFTKLV
jgi:hypothetical protein